MGHKVHVPLLLLREGSKSYKPEVEASKSDKRLHRYGHLKLCMYFPIGVEHLPLVGHFGKQNGGAHFAEKLSQQGQYPQALGTFCDGLPHSL